MRPRWIVALSFDLFLVLSIGLCLPACSGPSPPPGGHDPALRLRRLEPIWDFYSGVLLEVTGPGDDVFWLWPQEYWSWITESGERRGDFVQGEYIRDFRQDPVTGAITYGLTMAPRDCDIAVEIILASTP